MSHVTVLTGPERRRRWSEEEQCRVLAAAFAPGAKVAAVARQYDVATSLIYKWRRGFKAREVGFAEVVVVPDEPVAASAPAVPPAMIELEIAGKARLRISHMALLHEIGANTTGIGQAMLDNDFAQFVIEEA